MPKLKLFYICVFVYFLLLKLYVVVFRLNTLYSKRLLVTGYLQQMALHAAIIKLYFVIKCQFGEHSLAWGLKLLCFYCLFVCTTLSQIQIHFDIIQNNYLAALHINLYHSHQSSKHLVSCSFYLLQKLNVYRLKGRYYTG